jgi:redox-sensitive bicupin YhaK (pirin superfamily)
MTGYLMELVKDDNLLVGRSRDIGGLEVKRVLPHVTRQMVGPFIFFDQMGPNEFITEAGIDVRPHPHIGLATLTYLFSGHIFHRDSIGSFMSIKPGDVNLMISGRGITHSERTPKGIKTPHKLFGLQCWIALPKAHEAMRPEFHNLKKKEVPSVVSKSMIANIILGSAYGKTSPLKNIFNGVFIEIKVKNNNIIELPKHIEDYGIYVLSGKLEIKGRVINSGEMLVLTNKINLTVRTLENCHFIFLGGDTLNERRYLWWNFVASDVNLIERAKENWINKKFIMPIDDADEFIPLPQ